MGGGYLETSGGWANMKPRHLKADEQAQGEGEAKAGGAEEEDGQGKGESEVPDQAEDIPVPTDSNEMSFDEAQWKRWNSKS